MRTSRDAADLLEEAGVDSPTVRFLYDDTNSRREQQFTLIQEQAEEAGFEIVNEGDVNWGSRMGDGTYDASLFGWQSTSTGVTESDANFRTGQQNNYGGFSNEEVDELYDELQVETDPARQEEILAEAETILVDEALRRDAVPAPGAHHLQRPRAERLQHDRLAHDVLELLGLAGQLIGLTESARGFRTTPIPSGQLRLAGGAAIQRPRQRSAHRREP